MASTKQDNDGIDQDDHKLPESIQRLRAYTGRDVPFQSQNINLQQPLTKSQPLKGPYSKQPPVYVGSLSRKDLARKNRIQTALLGLGLGSMVLSIYGYTIWKRMQLGIDDTELARLEQEALQMVETGEIDLDAIQKQSDQAKIHKY
eukprot:UN11100